MKIKRLNNWIFGVELINSNGEFYDMLGEYIKIFLHIVILVKAKITMLRAQMTKYFKNNI